VLEVQAGGLQDGAPAGALDADVAAAGLHVHAQGAVARHGALVATVDVDLDLPLEVVVDLEQGGAGSSHGGPGQGQQQRGHLSSIVMQPPTPPTGGHSAGDIA
jgi:hypothetical protein